MERFMGFFQGLGIFTAVLVVVGLVLLIWTKLDQVWEKVMDYHRYRPRLQARADEVEKENDVLRSELAALKELQKTGAYR
jgi:hypothetical protein